MSDSLLALKVFQQIAEQGSFALAASRLSLERSKATRLVAQLEKQLGARLLNRTTRAVALTPAGEAYLSKITPALTQLDEANSEVAQVQQQPSGLIRLSAPVSFGARYLGVALAKFAQEQRGIHIETMLDDHFVDLNTSGVDLALRISSEPAATQVSRGIAPVTIGLFMSPQAIRKHAEPKQPSDLARIPYLGYLNSTISMASYFKASPGASRQQATDTAKLDKAHLPTMKANLSANNGEFLAQACAEQVGYVTVPWFIVAEQVQRGELVPILRPLWRAPARLQAALPSRKYQPNRVRALIDFLIERWSKNPPWEPK